MRPVIRLFEGAFLFGDEGFRQCEDAPVESGFHHQSRLGQKIPYPRGHMGPEEGSLALEKLCGPSFVSRMQGRSGIVAEMAQVGEDERQVVLGQVDALGNAQLVRAQLPVYLAASLAHELACPLSAKQRFEGLGRAALAGADAVEGAGEVGGQLLFGARVPQAQRSVQIAIGRREGGFAVAGQPGEVAGGQGVNLLLGQRLIVQRGEQAVQGGAIFEKVDGAGEVGHGGLLR